MVTSSSASSSLKEYLKRYESNIEEEKKKKKKKKKPRADVTGVVVVDEDPVWQKQVNLEEEENDSADEEKPQIDEDIEVKRMKRLEQLRARRPFGVISEDGSGWVPVSDAPTSSNTRDQLSDISPPRRMTRNDTPSPGPESRPSSTAIADLSPPRKRRARNDKLSPEPEREPSSKADADLSPQRKRRARNDSPSPLHELKPSSTTVGDLSPHRQRRERYESPSPEPETKFSRSLGTGSKQLKLNDISPPRRRRAHYDTPSPRSDLETSKSGREVVDLSPPRRQRQRQHSPSPEPGRKASRPMAVGSDLSPPRRSYLQKSSDNIWKNSDMADMPDNSAPSRIRRSSPYQDDSGSSPAGDLSPPRKSRKDRSPPQSRHPVSKNDTAVSDLSRSRRRQKESPVPIQQPKTGLVTGRDVKEEVTKTKNEEWLRFKEMDASVSGRGAEPVFRDKITGKRMSKEEFLKSQKKEKDEKPKEIKLEWGKGLAQKREAEARLKELELEKEKPFARSRDDPELDRMLKDRVRWGDPMAHLVKKKPLEPVLPDFGDNEKVKESGFIIPQEIPSHSWIKRGLDAPPNRYGIKPGRHWDGVDRSNGTEKQFFKRMNEKQATEREAYLWSVADM